ncbi:hypothetical protein Tco_0017881 [Tanacetum coccineum]
MDDPKYYYWKKYISLKEEKARRRGIVFNWETAKYGKIWYDEDVYNLRSVETEFPAIVFNNNVTSNETLSCEPTVSSLNDEINFRISFDESDDEDYAEPYGISYGLGCSVLIPDLAETMIWYILKRTCVELIRASEALVNTLFAQELILENYHE